MTIGDPWGTGSFRGGRSSEAQIRQNNRSQKFINQQKIGNKLKKIFD